MLATQNWPALKLRWIQVYLRLLTVPRVTYRCTTCHSTDVYVDAGAAWNPETQQNELAQTLDMTWCNNCDGESRLEEVSYP